MFKIHVTDNHCVIHIVYMYFIVISVKSHYRHESIKVLIVVEVLIGLIRNKSNLKIKPTPFMIIFTEAHTCRTDRFHQQYVR